MNNKWSILLSIALFVILSACSKKEDDGLIQKDLSREIVFSAEFGEDQTKTAFQSDEVSIWWSPQDAISVFYGASDGNKFISTNAEEVAQAEFRGTLNAFTGEYETGVSHFFWAVYPYSSAISCDGTSVVATLNEDQIAQAGSFAPNTNVAIARSSGLNLSFNNACSWFRFKLKKEGVKRVILKGNGNEDIAGSFRISIGQDGKPTVKEVIDGKKEIVLHLQNYDSFLVGEWYYFTLLPQVFENGCTVTIKTDSEIGTRIIKNKEGKAVFLRSKYNSSENLDRDIQYTEDPNAGEFSNEGGKESGLYLGISTFDRVLSYNPVHLISEESLEDYKAIVDNMALATKNGTLLYYSIDEDITSIKKVPLPEDLFNVSLVTFTDGLDQGSLSKRRGMYEDDMEYLDAIRSRMDNEFVSGLPIKSFAIGLMGADAQSNPTLFQTNLEKIASTPTTTSEKYVYKASNMTEVNTAFGEIASQLSQNFKVQKLEITIPFPSGNGTKERFVLDNKTASNSTKYIEGVFDMSTLSLKNVTYKGLTSTSGEIVPSVLSDDEFELTYTFEGIPVSDGGEIVTSNIHHYSMRPTETSWQINSEFHNTDDCKTYTEVKSALVMLNIDLSISLSGQLTNLQSSVKSFLSKLYNNAVDPNVIKSVKLNKKTLDLIAGQSETLIAKISPSTAPASGLKWVSTRPSIATVDQNGNVTGIAEGSTTITVSTSDDNILASCTVNVQFKHVESISLNKTELTIFTGKKETLYTTITPTNASNKNVIWQSSDPSIATVTSSGEVTGIALGTASITAKSVDGDKTATCEVIITDYIPSSKPIDLSLAVWYSPNKGSSYIGYIPYDDIQYVNLSDYQAIGLTILSNNGDMIMALEDASSDEMYHDASLFYNMPTKDQGIIISARWDNINQALQRFGGESLKRGIWTTGSYKSGLYTYYYYVNGSGGTVSLSGSSSGDSDQYVREVLPIDNASYNCFITKSKGIGYSYINNAQRHIVNSPTNIPAGCSVDGVAVFSSTGIGSVIISLKDASSTAMTWSAACSCFGQDNLPTKQQALLISARLTEVNNALTNCGGEKLVGYDNGWKYYWTSDCYYEQNHWYYYYLCNGGCRLSITSSTTDKYFVRLVNNI